MMRTNKTYQARTPDYRLGDVVTRQDRIELMTVEGVRDTPFGPSLNCCWFDRNNALHYAEVPARQLDLFPRAFHEGEMSIGQTVCLRSRGPVMRVVGFEEQFGQRRARCEWTSPTLQSRQRLFPCDGLVPGTLLERFDGPDGPLFQTS